MPDLLLEIGCEEIPARFLADALPELERRASALFAQAQLAAARVQTLGTPRRLALCVHGLAARQPDVDETLVGPPVNAGAKAAEAFAKKYRLDRSAIQEQDTDKGRRLVARRQVRGQETAKLLPELVAGLIRDLPWPKSMRWGDHPETFVRPVHWLVALFDGEVVPIEFAGVRAGRASRGHRFLAGQPFDASSIEGWRSELRKRHVIVDPVERRQLIEAELLRIERETRLKVRPDPALLEEVTNLVEYPVGVSGSFDERFLEVPEPVIVSALRSHQRYFAMTTPAGKLAHQFVTIAGTVVKDPAVVAHGNERVLRARLSDARFFFDEDRKLRLSEWAQKLEGIVWIKQLGTMRQKVERVFDYARVLATMLGVESAKVGLAAQLAKADLPTHMVGEFPELQGTIGSAYARLEGIDREVADAIAEHYRPRGADDRPAEGPVGAVLAIADRLDSLVGIFKAGLAPTGSADPYGARRAALGILATLLAHNWHVSLGNQCERVAVLFGAPDGVPAVLEFLRGRLRGLFADEFPADVVDAVLAADSDDPVDARARVRALSVLRPRADFEPLGVAIKRVGNILKGGAPGAALDPALLREPAEKALFEAAGAIRRRVEPHLAAHQYDDALRELATFKAPVDTFFDQVFVMDKDAQIRDNRLALLASINQLFLRVADFRQLNLG
ncbi:MAG TPA: glycine--tRNA ligase subunit beta [Polyangia bacterium]|nr:glycine--tRNA ligase subunit beta [Polyangia bacterium]